MKRPTYHDDLIKRLKSPSYALGYLNASLEDEEEAVFFLALKNVAEAHGGLLKLAKKTGLNREHLFRMLSKRGNPRFESIVQLTKAMGWKLAIVEQKAA